MRKSLLALAAVVGISFAAGTANAGWIVGGTANGVPPNPPANNNFQADLLAAGVNEFWSPATLALTADVIGVDFYFMGAESGEDNTFSSAAAGISFTETADADNFPGGVLIGSGGTVIDYQFSSTFGGGTVYALGTLEFGVFETDNPNVIFMALDDNGAGPDDNHDDIIIMAVARTAAVPEPEILALIGAGLLGTGFAARRRRNS